MLLLQSRAGIRKWDNYNRKGRYIFVSPEQVYAHAYWQGKCGSRTEFYMTYCPSVDSNRLRKIHTFTRAHIIYDAFTLKGYAIFRIADNSIMTYTLNQTFQEAHYIFSWRHANLNQIRKCSTQKGFFRQKMHCFFQSF